MESRALHISNEISNEAEASVPGVASMSGGVSYARSEDEATARENIVVDFGPYPIFDETEIVIPCDNSSTTYRTLCGAARDVGDTTSDEEPADGAVSQSR